MTVCTLSGDQQAVGLPGLEGRTLVVGTVESRASGMSPFPLQQRARIGASTEQVQNAANAAIDCVYQHTVEKDFSVTLMRPDVRAILFVDPGSEVQVVEAIKAGKAIGLLWSEALGYWSTLEKISLEAFRLGLPLVLGNLLGFNSGDVQTAADAMRSNKAGKIYLYRAHVTSTANSLLETEGLQQIGLMLLLLGEYPTDVQVVQGMEPNRSHFLLLTFSFRSSIVASIDLHRGPSEPKQRIEMFGDLGCITAELSDSQALQGTCSRQAADTLQALEGGQNMAADAVMAASVLAAMVQSSNHGNRVRIISPADVMAHTEPVEAPVAGLAAATEPGHSADCAAHFAASAASVGNQYGATYRDYTDPSTVGRPSVEENYRLNHVHQTYDFVCSEEERWGRMGRRRMSVWEAVELLNEVVDDSDPDTALPQLEHMLQTAEAIRAAYPEEDWFHLTGLIHDLGKVLAHPDFGAQPQWAVVGDTFPVGCAHDPRIVFHSFFQANPDAQDPRFSSRCGVYQPGCGLRRVKMSWGHDEYFYRVLCASGCRLPPEALFIVRYHSFYVLHQHGGYDHLLDAHDRAMLPWLQRFQKFDLYSKTDGRMDTAALKQYYQGLITKYFPNDVLVW